MIETVTKRAAEKLFALALAVAAVLLIFSAEARVSTATADTEHAYLGFDRNVYPGDDALPILRKTFAFTSYWLSPPPGEKRNTWKGKRSLLLSHKFGFLVLYRGRDSAEFKNDKDAQEKGIKDASAAAVNAKEEGFASGTILFLDIEEGGRLPAAYHTYLHAWLEELHRDNFVAGVYCSGIPVKEEPGVSISTADDIRNHAASRDFIFWVFNDMCPPSPGCVFPQNPPTPSRSGISYAGVWQFAQSPRRKDRTPRCAATYFRDGNCYSPNDTAHQFHLDVNSATSPDPSNGAK